METNPTIDVALVCAVVNFVMTSEERATLRTVLREQCRIDVDSGAEGLALAYAEQQTSERRFPRLWESVFSFLSDDTWTRIDAALDPATRAALVRTSRFDGVEDVVAMAVGLTTPEALRGERYVQLVVEAVKVLVLNPPTAELEQDRAAAARVFAQTDPPPSGETTDPAPANDSQGELSEETPVLVYRDAVALLELLRRAEAEVHAEIGRHAMAAEDADSAEALVARRVLEASARGEARALRRARAFLLGSAPALIQAEAAASPPEELAAPLPSRLRADRTAGAPRPCEFAWGSPSVHGYRPAVVDGQTAIEVHVLIPDERGVHPAYGSAGHEVADRVGTTIARLVDRNGNAVQAVIRVDLFEAGDPTLAATFRPAWRAAGPDPIAAETTSSGCTVMLCPWCGEEQPIPARRDEPGLFAGDPVTKVCEHCGRSVELRMRDRAVISARPIHGACP